MFRIVRLSIIKSLFTVHSALVCVIQVCKQLLSRTRIELQFHPGPARHIALLSVHWINSWCWTVELSETCRVSCQNKFVKLVYLVCFIIKKFVTKHGHVNVKDLLFLHIAWISCRYVCNLWQYPLRYRHACRQLILIVFLHCRIRNYNALCVQMSWCGWK